MAKPQQNRGGGGGGGGGGAGRDMRMAADEGQAAPFQMASGLSLVEIITLTDILFSDRHITNDLGINIVCMVMLVLQTLIKSHFLISSCNASKLQCISSSVYQSCNVSKLRCISGCDVPAFAMY